MATDQLNEVRGLVEIAGTDNLVTHGADASRDGIGLADTLRAFLNILEDFAEEKSQTEDAQTAMLNILGDFADDGIRLADSQRALLNILEDFDVEKRKVDHVNEELRTEVAERSRTEESLELTARDLTLSTAELAASNGDLEAFSYSVAHDLRAPLRAIAGYSRLLEKKYGSTLDETASGYVWRIAKGAERMGNMIDDLLRFARLGRQELSRQMVDPALLARDALDDLQAEIEGRGLDVVIEEMPPMWADRALVHHVYLNLLSNAVKFTGGRPDARIVVSSTVGPDGACVYSVEDNGAGFDMKYAHNLFGVFQRLHGRDEFEGTGVGLALVKAIVERHGGNVWAEAELDAGATLSFTIGGHS